jgi:hypothetical protein
MSETAIGQADAAPVSLYLDLEEGRIADLEVVARSALAWSSAIKEIMYILDPSVEIRIELASGTEGSLSLNAWVKKLRGSPESRRSLWAAVAGLAAWLTCEIGSYTVGAIIDYLRSDNAPPEVRQMTAAEIEQLASVLANKMAGNIAREQRQELYRELSRDPAIKGVGVSPKPSVRPSLIVPREEFKRMSGSAVEERVIERRSKSERLKVTLISPILKGAPRSWRFQYGTFPEFGAVMKDQRFLDAIEQGRIAFSLRAGIEMEVEMETKEEFEGGVWVVKERAITEVYNPAGSGRDELPLFGK